MVVVDVRGGGIVFTGGGGEELLTEREIEKEGKERKKDGDRGGERLKFCSVIYSLPNK